LEPVKPFELDVLLVSDLNQEGFNPRETPRDGLHDGDGLNSSTTVRVFFGILGTLFADASSPVFSSGQSFLTGSY
jgi:hypothetical protein